MPSFSSSSSLSNKALGWCFVNHSSSVFQYVGVVARSPISFRERSSYEFRCDIISSSSSLYLFCLIPFSLLNFFNSVYWNVQIQIARALKTSFSLDFEMLFLLLSLRCSFKERSVFVLFRCGDDLVVCDRVFIYSRCFSCCV